MAVPLQVEPFLTFLGTNEAQTHVALPAVFSPSGSQNVFINKQGQVKRIDGYTKKNSSAKVTHNSSAAATFTGLFGLRRLLGSGFGTSRSLVGILEDGNSEWEVWSSTDEGVTWTWSATFTTLTASQNPDFAQYKNDLFITNGYLAPKKWTGSATTSVGGTQSPTVTATAGSSTTNALDGVYRYKLVSCNATGVRFPGSVASTAETVHASSMTLSWTADADTNVIGYELYRTTGTGNLYYFVTWIEGRTTVAYTDTSSDALILEHRSLNEHGEAPATGTRFVETHGDRVWWMGHEDTPYRAYWSDLALPESVGVNSYLDFIDPAGTAQKIVGGLGNFEKKLVVFTDVGVWTVSGTGAVIGPVVDWTKRKSNATAGAVSHRVAVQVPAGAVYRDAEGAAHKTAQVMVAYLTPNLDVRLFDGNDDVVISDPVKDSLAAMSYSARSRCHAYHDVAHGEIAWFYAHSSATTPDRAVVWNYRLGTWYRWFTLPFIASTVMDAAATSQKIFVSEALTSKGGYVYQMESGNSFDGSAIDARWMSGTIYGRIGEDSTGRERPLPAASDTKRFRWVDFLATTASGVTLTVEWYNGHAPDGATALGSQTFTPSDTSLETSQRKVLLHTASVDYLHDEGIRLRVGNSSASTSAWSIDGFYLAFQLLAGTKRRFQ